MIREVNEHEFISDLVNDKYNSMTYEGARVLFEWYELLEESNGEAIHFNHNDIRCEWTEYDNLTEVLKEYDHISTFNELRDNTIVLEIPESDGLVIQDF